MNAWDPIARAYLMPPRNSLWKWQESGDVLTWPSGRTIAFRTEVQLALRALQAEGLPPLGAVALVLAACRDNWKEAQSELFSVVQLRASYGEWWHVLSTDAVELLDGIGKLPAVLRQSAQAKAVICQIVFQGVPPVISASHAPDVTAVLDQQLPEDYSARTDAEDTPPGDPVRELLLLRAGLARVNAEAIELRLQTGLDQLPQAAKIELTRAEQMRALLSQLESDEELRGLAKLARQLMAAVTLPSTLADREELPIGGVSDLTNRGSFDQLLLSELANDDLTLAVRVALNEALYLRRETPPRNPPRQRTILLESGIRSWGVPRVFSTAVAMALTATDTRSSQVLAFRASKDELLPVTLTTPAGLTSQLAALDHAMHPGAALPAFLQQLAGLENAAEPVLVTTDDVLEDPEFLQCLRQFQLPLYVATVNRLGQFCLLERTLRGFKQIRTARLNLGDLFNQPSRAVPSLVNSNLPSDLPAIFRVPRFPLLLPHSIEYDRCVSLMGLGTLAATRDDRLMLWSSPLKGALQLSDQIPCGRIHWLDPESNHKQAAILMGNLQARQLCRVNIQLESLACEHTPLEVASDTRTGAWGSGGIAYLFGKHHMDLVDMQSGRKIERRGLPDGAKWQRGPFLRTEAGVWYALPSDGSDNWHCVNATVTRFPPLAAVFERPGMDGYWGVTLRGDLMELPSGRLHQVSHPLGSFIQVLAISQDGERVVIKERLPEKPRGRQGVILVSSRKFRESPGVPAILAEPLLGTYLRPSLRKFASQIYVDRRGLLNLVTRSGKWLIDYDPTKKAIVLRLNTWPLNTVSEMPAFKPVPGQPSGSYRLSVAKWNEGSQAFLDSRGLLHLKSSDRGIPEVSIVLADPALSGWCSDGRVWGAPYFHDQTSFVPAEEIYNRCIWPFAARLQTRDITLTL